MPLRGALTQTINGRQFLSRRNRVINVPSAPTFYVIPGSAAKRAVESHRKDVFDAVEAAYRLHASGNTVNPDSYFLRYPDKPSARIIALPAHLGGAVQISGIKWISSFPENRASNLARASAVLILNDATTGYPVACIEASLISATRTGASAALAAEHISLNPFEGTLGIVGTGVIARTTVEWLLFEIGSSARSACTMPTARKRSTSASRFASSTTCGRISRTVWRALFPMLPWSFSPQHTQPNLADETCLSTPRLSSIYRCATSA